MNYALIRKNDIANGPGVRVSLFVSGCRHHCKGCFNPETWNFSYGKPFTDETVEEILHALKPEYISGLSLLGGEPFEPENQAALLKLTSLAKETYPQKKIWCYSGFTFEDRLSKGAVGDPETCLALLQNIDVLVDGTFKEELKDASLLFRGSANQNIIDVQKSLKEGKMILLEGKWKRTMGSGDINEI
jgi:anaerobic ribonucleoside-triphosphate reductase activating protein